jgi:molybdenum cofactor cytidylyltransferase
MTVGAILLAAGSARRMGEDKLIADLGGKPLAEHVLTAIHAAGLAGPIVAVAPGSSLLSRFEGRGRFVEVTDHALGMGHSLRAAIGQVPPEWTAALICLADMPFVRPKTLALLASRATVGAIIRPIHEGRPGNPLLWGRDHFAMLARLTGDRGGRDLLRQHPAELMECGDGGVLIDIDTPEALDLARRRAFP